MLRYGTSYPLENKSIREKSFNTSKERYGGLMTHAREGAYRKFNSNPFASEEVKAKIRQTLYRKYGVTHPCKNAEILKKRRETFQKKYGRNERPQLHINDETWNILTNREKFRDLYIEQGTISLSRTLGVSDGTVTRLVDMYGLERRGQRSSYENALMEYFTSLGVPFEQNNRTLYRKHFPENKEIDFIVDERLAIEFCGLFFHSSYGSSKISKGKYSKDRNYHLNKLVACNKENIKLLTIFEDEWLARRDVVLNKINYFLGRLERGHRKTSIREIPYRESKIFLDRYHLQGSNLTNTVRLGAFQEDNLVAVMTFGSNSSYPMMWELKRFATDFKVYPGLAGKMLAWFERNYHPYAILSYADRRWSDGELYRELGFELDGTTKPGYSYTNYRTRVHRSNFSKEQIRRKYNVDGDFNEIEFMLTRGWDIIWDCGNLRFIKRYYR
jgi:hypothetical protein